MNKEEKLKLNAGNNDTLDGKSIECRKAINVTDEENAPTEYGKYVDECLNEAAKHFFSEGEDKYSVADLFYAGVRCGKSWLEKQGEQKASYTTIVETGDGGINALVTRELPTDGEQKSVEENKGYDCSEDEKMRKELIGMLSKYKYVYGKKIAWLEKQSTDISSFPKEQQVFMQPYVSLDKITLIKLLAERDANNAEIIESFEKQIEQKPFDYENTNIQQKDFAPKNEPKFKVGDWVVQKGLGIYKIVEVCESWYEVISYKDGIQYSIGFDKENDCHLWTIQDAKEGDVLSYVTDEEDLWIMIYWSLYEPYEGHVHYHALLINDNFSCRGTCCICIDNLKPATKEQRDLFFQKMEEAGYEWDAEKKGLSCYMA